MKKIRTLSVIALSFLVLTSCGGNDSVNPTTTNTPATTTTTTTAEETTPQTSYNDNVTLKVSGSPKREVELGQEISIKVMVSGTTASEDKGVTYSGFDETIISITQSGNTGTVKGLKEGSTVVTISANANPNKKQDVTITVIPAKPSLRQVFKNIQELDSYTITTGTADTSIEEIDGETGIVYVTENTIVHTDYDGGDIYKVKDDKVNRFYGETVTETGDVVYIVKQNGKFITENSPLVQTNAGLLDASNFKGMKEGAIQPDEVGMFYSYDAINPEWLSDEKSEDNRYELEGYVLDDETGLPLDIAACYVESILWQLIDKESYDSAVSSINEAYYYALSGMVKTTFVVTGASTVEIMLETEGGEAYMAVMGDINKTTLDDEINEIGTLEGFTAAKPVQGDKFEEGVAALKTNNYIQSNSVFPDHETECKYFTYFNPNYVFYDCNEAYRNTYNNLTENKWEQKPYGFAKKADGIYRFEYNEPNEGVAPTADNIVWSTTKEEGTDGTTSLPEFAKYFSTVDSLNTDLKYAFGTAEDAIWSGRSTKYYSARSFRIYYDFTQYYAPEDVSDCIEVVQVGFSVTKKDGVVTKVEGTMGAAPFDASKLAEHTYGVNYFAIDNFGNAANNVVDALLGL